MVFGIQLGGSGGNNSAAVKQEDSETTNSNGKAPAAPAAKTVNRQQPLQPAPPGPTNRASPAASSVKTDTNTHDTPKTTGNNNNSSSNNNNTTMTTSASVHLATSAPSQHSRQPASFLAPSALSALLHLATTNTMSGIGVGPTDMMDMSALQDSMDTALQSITLSVAIASTLIPSSPVRVPVQSSLGVKKILEESNAFRSFCGFHDNMNNSNATTNRVPSP